MDLKMEYKDTNAKYAVVITQKHTAWVSDRIKKRSTEILFRRDWIQENRKVIGSKPHNSNIPGKESR